MDHSVIKNVTTQPSLLLLGVCLQLEWRDHLSLWSMYSNKRHYESRLMCVVESWAVCCELNSVQYEVVGREHMERVIWEGFLKGDDSTRKLKCTVECSCTAGERESKEDGCVKQSNALVQLER